MTLTLNPADYAQWQRSADDRMLIAARLAVRLDAAGVAEARVLAPDGVCVMEYVRR